MTLAMQKPVDLTHLSRYTGGERALNAEILQLFVDQSAELMRQLHAVIEARDVKAWRDITHSLKGAARGVGAFEFAQAVAEAEPLDLTIQHAPAIAALETLKARSDAVNAFVARYLAG
jgi:HPt (histidine-containing phosphotransfer) domain-containing protein